MAVRIREGGSPIVCAAMHPELPGDTYIPDGLHHRLSVDYGVLVSEPMEKHQVDGLWWWFNEVPPDRTPEPFYAKARMLVRDSPRMARAAALSGLIEWLAAPLTTPETDAALLRYFIDARAMIHAPKEPA